MNEHQIQHNALLDAVGDLEAALRTYDESRREPANLAQLVADIVRASRRFLHELGAFRGRSMGLGAAAAELDLALQEYDQPAEPRVILTRIARVLQGARHVVAVARGQGRGTMDRVSAVRVGV